MVSLLLFLAIPAVIAIVFTALCNPVWIKLSTTIYPSLTSPTDYIRVWAIYMVTGTLGAFLLQLFVKFGPQIEGLLLLPVIIGTVVAMGIMTLLIYG